MSVKWLRLFVAGATLVDRARGIAASVPVRAKVLGVVCFVVGVLGLAVLVELRQGLSRELLAGLDARAVTIARDIAARATDAVLTDRTFDLHQLLRDALRHDEDVRYAFVTDQQGQVLAHTFPRSVPAALVALNKPRSEPALVRFTTDDGVISDAAAHILMGRKGIVRVGLSHASVARALRRSIGRLVLTFLAALALGIGVAFALTNILARPIIQLVRTARAVEEGDLTARARVFARDEIGALAVAFNAMTDALTSAQEDLERRLVDLRALSATAEALAGDSDESIALERVIDAMMPPLSALGGWILLLTDGAPPWRLAARRGLSPSLPAGAEMEHLAGCPCEVSAVVNGHPIVEVAHGSCSILPGLGSCPDSSIACVSLVAEDRLVGVMYLVLPASAALSVERRAILETVGRHVGTAMENVRLGELTRVRERRRGQLLGQVIEAQEAERRRVARDLHDEAGQVLTTLLLRLRTLETRASLDVSAKQDVGDAQDLARHLFDELHRIASVLRPSVLDRVGLAEAIRAMATSFERSAGFTVDVDTEDFDDADIPAHRITALYRIVQEALANVAKHAEASHVSVLVTRDVGRLCAIIEDDGCGFDIDSALGAATGDRPSLGLFGMLERAELLGGRVAIESIPGSGTTVKIEAPSGVPA